MLYVSWNLVNCCITVWEITFEKACNWWTRNRKHRRAEGRRERKRGGREGRYKAYTPNFMWMCSLCWLPVAKNHNFEQILTFAGLPYRPPFTDEGQIWCAITDPRSTLTHQILLKCVHCVGFLLVVRSINVSIVQCFWDIITFTAYVTLWLPVTLRSPSVSTQQFRL